MIKRTQADTYDNYISSIRAIESTDSEQTTQEELSISIIHQTNKHQTTDENFRLPRNEENSGKVKGTHNMMLLMESRRNQEKRKQLDPNQVYQEAEKKDELHWSDAAIIQEKFDLETLDEAKIMLGQMIIDDGLEPTQKQLENFALPKTKHHKKKQGQPTEKLSWVQRKLREFDRERADFRKEKSQKVDKSEVPDSNSYQPTLPPFYQKIVQVYATLEPSAHEVCKYIDTEQDIRTFLKTAKQRVEKEYLSEYDAELLASITNIDFQKSCDFMLERALDGETTWTYVDDLYFALLCKQVPDKTSLEKLKKHHTFLQSAMIRCSTVDAYGELMNYTLVESFEKVVKLVKKGGREAFEQACTEKLATF